ncbi:MAG: RluA family pseudouridine synthase [Betaproteobacteria bacterium]|nr:RluA family pseudouridine synthase [Betaproteobacteria bacterium]
MGATATRSRRAARSADYSLAPAADAALSGEIRAVIPVECAGLRLDQALARLFPQYSRSRLQAWLKNGVLQVDGSAPQSKHRVRGAERVVLALPSLPREASPAAQRLPLSIIHEDAEILVIDKPAGLVVHPGAGNPDHTLMNALLAHAPALAGVPRAGIVHRLDKDTSGLLVVAKTLAAQTSLVRQLQARSLGRTYMALVWGSLRGAKGLVDAPIGRDARSRTRMAVTDRGKPARTDWAVNERMPDATLLVCTLHSGRTHQIRVHLQSIGHPLVGDPVYRRGAKTLPLGAFKRQALHAARLELVHPRSGRTRRWESPLPEDFLALLLHMRNARAG